MRTVDEDRLIGGPLHGAAIAVLSYFDLRCAQNCNIYGKAKAKIFLSGP